jgi:hypothetical protein
MFLEMTTTMEALIGATLAQAGWWGDDHPGREEVKFCKFVLLLKM